MTQVVAGRAIYGIIADIETKVLVKLWHPESADGGGSLCRYSFDADGAEHPLEDGAGHGIDDMQALVMALQGVGWALDRSGIEWSMFTNAELSAEGVVIRDHGFPSPGMDLTFFGSTFRKRIETYVEREKIEAMRLWPRFKKPRPTT